jgi:GT2 family glycosyltransferase
MSNTFKLAIVIVNYRTGALAIDCLKSLAVPGTVPAQTRIVVVDGASGDDSVDKIKDAIRTHGWCDHVSLLSLSENRGFAYGNNRGVAHARQLYGRPQYILFLNPDTIARPGGIVPLVEFMDTHTRAGVAGSRLEDPDGSGQACAFRFPSFAAEIESEARFGPVTRLLHRWRIAPDMYDTPTLMDWVSGASMIVTTELFEQLGGFDESYFLYYEEVDFCMRAARAGWECWHVPESRIIHLVGQSTGVTVRQVRPARRPAYWFESRRRFFVTHYGRAYTALANAGWIAGHLIWRARLIVQGKASSASPYLLYDFIRHAVAPSDRRA